MSKKIILLLVSFFMVNIIGHAKGYVVLSSGKDIQNQLTKSEMVYEIRDNFRVKGKLSIPANSTLLFRGGSIVGGDIVFNGTELDGSVSFSSVNSISGTIANEIILSRWFVDIPDLFRLLNELISNNDNKRIIISKNKYSVRTPLLIRRRTGLELDFNGATIIDETQGESKLMHRANSMIFIRASNNITIKNLKYEISESRYFGDTGTDIICVGATSADWDEDTYNINLFNIEGSGDLVRSYSKGKQIESGFISFYGNVHDCSVEGLLYNGNVGHLCNIEYGLAPDKAKTYKDKYSIILPDYYGLHPYNIRISNITGVNSPKSSGYLRTSSCYNIIFENCYGYNVNRLFYLYSGDQSINRVNGSVVVRNCASYINEKYDNTSLYGMMIQNVYINPNSKVPHEKGIRHNLSYVIENCEFQGLPGKGGSGILLTGNDGGVMIRNVTVRNFDSAFDAYADSRQERFCNLIVENCLFEANKKGMKLNGMKSPQISSTRFFSDEKSGAQVIIADNSENVSITDCEFVSESKSSTIIVENSAGNGHLITKSRFNKDVKKAINDRSQKVVVE